MTTTCRGCGREWASLSQCHCTMCHLQFSGITAFDDHLLTDSTGTRCRTEQELLSGRPRTARRAGKGGNLRKVLAPRPERFGDVWRYPEHKPQANERPSSRTVSDETPTGGVSHHTIEEGPK